MASLILSYLFLSSSPRQRPLTVLSEAVSALSPGGCASVAQAHIGSAGLHAALSAALPPLRLPVTASLQMSPRVAWAPSSSARAALPSISPHSSSLHWGKVCPSRDRPALWRAPFIPRGSMRSPCIWMCSQLRCQPSLLSVSSELFLFPWRGLIVEPDSKPDSGRAEHRRGGGLSQAARVPGEGDQHAQLGEEAGGRPQAWPAQLRSWNFTGEP